ncbi:unnamed protein product [Eruca vesicaria subsp. sativa]|uniref:Uncharacterized protein n=1 Tax=Eruca vesicaria subsp. sativa TaxID=29727 RepID=A0ABC8KXE5_ERUVS|nr:unnamed protein product [Eruca vesicaria subsp. sativa]
MSISHTEFPQKRIAGLLPNASSEVIDLITRLFSRDPLKRPTADQALNDPFFNMATQASYPLHGLELRLNTMAAEMPNLELNLWDFNTSVFWA